MDYGEIETWLANAEQTIRLYPLFPRGTGAR